MVDFDHYFGLTSYGMMNAGGETMKFADGFELPIEYDKKFICKSVGAEVLATDSEGDVVFSRNAYGKGWIYFMGCPMEKMLWERPMAFASPGNLDYARVYRTVGEKALASHPVRVDNRQIGMTLHPDGDGWYAVLINYDNQVQDAGLVLNGDYDVKTIYGDYSAVEPCSMAVLRIDSKN